MLDDLARLRDGHTRRVSGWDRTGGNADRLVIDPGATQTLARIDGAGTIRHIWVTVACADESYLRKVVLRMFWDGMDRPSVEVPLGDFFGIGHARVSSYSSVVLNMSAGGGQDQRAAMNCYFPMPFGDGAQVEVENRCDVPIRAFYYYIDYDEQESQRDDVARFHAQWRRANPCPPTADREARERAEEDPKGNLVPNLSDRDNYLILEAEGRGHYVGCNLSIHNLYGGWWGEGDDMFMIDGVKWPPDMHGTGSEDYFTHAWGMQPQNAYAYAGVSYQSGPVESFNERTTVYRYHIADPVIFHESIRVSIEHGHANDRCDDYSSTAYWYQTLPHARFPHLPPAGECLPRPDVTLYPLDLPVPPAPGRGYSGLDIAPDILPPATRT